MKRPTFANVRAYIAAQAAPARPVLARVRATILKALPGATEGISYQIPVYKLDGAMVLYFAGYARHYAIYPMTPHVVAPLEQELKGLLHGRATVRFPITGAVPTRLITRIAKLRAEEAAERLVTRTSKAKVSKKTKVRTRTKSAKPRRGKQRRQR
jgi:uncharacterized protein YdhG (YjbR/CyaY superfamily)